MQLDGESQPFVRGYDLLPQQRESTKGVCAADLPSDFVHPIHGYFMRND